MVMNGSQISCGPAKADARAPNNPHLRHIANCNYDVEVKDKIKSNLNLKMKSKVHLMPSSIFLALP